MPPTSKAPARHRATIAHLSRVPGLRISIGDGRSAVRAGDRLTYTVLVHNSGADRSPPLKITQTLSPGLRLVSASRHGVARAGRVTWNAELAGGGKGTFKVRAQLTRLPARQSRLAAVACATLVGSRAPIVCASHLDLLPGAAAATAGHRAAATASSTTSRLPSYAAGLLAVLVICALAILVGRHRRVRRRRGG